MNQIEKYLKAYKDWCDSQPQIVVEGTRNGLTCEVRFFVNQVGGISLDCGKDHPSRVRYPDEVSNKDLKDVLTTTNYKDIGHWPVILFDPENTRKIQEWFKQITAKD